MEVKDLADNTNWKKIKKEYKSQGSRFSKLQSELLQLCRDHPNDGELIWSRLEELCQPEQYIEYLKTEPWPGNKHIQELFEPTSFYNRQDLARKLKEVADRRITTPLLTLLKTEEDWFVKTQLLGVCGQLKDVRTLEPLISFLNDDSWQVSYDAACAIARIGKPESLPYLISYTEKQESSRGLSRALKALGQLRRPEVLPVFKDALKSPHQDIQIGAIEGLKHLKSPEAFKLLKEFLGKAKKEVRAKIIELISHYSPTESLPILIERLKDPSFLVRRAACFGLANLREDEALVPLSELLMDSYCVNNKYPVREAAKLAIKKFKGGKEFLAALEADIIPPRSARGKSDSIEPETLVDEDGVTQPRLGAIKSKILATYRNPANIINPGIDDEISDPGTKKAPSRPPSLSSRRKKVRVSKIIRQQDDGVQKTTKSKGISKVIGNKEELQQKAKEMEAKREVKSPRKRISRISRRRR